MSRFPGRYVFVGGLHRSGTSLVARLLAAHPAIASITGAPIPEAEGVYLQGAIPHTARSGIPGEFAFDPDQHMTEHHPLNRLETRERMETDWEMWFSAGREWRVEKSPVNLLRMRLYQQLFPLSHFVIVVRHPLSVARSTAKWSDRTEAELVRHWEHAHDLALGDVEFLHHALILRHEDLCDDPARAGARLFRFLGLDPGEAGRPEAIRSPEPPDLSGYVPGPVALRLGYGGAGDTDGRDSSLADLLRHPLREVREAAAIP